MVGIPVSLCVDPLRHYCEAETDCINNSTDFLWYRTGFVWGDLRERRKEVPLLGCAGRNMDTG